jgi:FkbH-like protein
MVLRKKDFAAWRINWKDKAGNLMELAEELNLGLDSFVFLDDSPQEREQVRQMLPQVFTPELPTSPSELAPFLASLNRFEVASLGREDTERTQSYQAERGRKEARELIGDVENWLRSLEIEVRASPLRRETLARVAQLLNKTNQFNLSLRRMDEESFWAWANDPDNSVFVFQVSDRFGDSGLTGMASLSKVGNDARIVDFVMSCRVMGKKVEEALLAYMCSQARANGADRILASAINGPRNAPVREFFAAKYSSGEEASLDCARVSVPATIQLTEDKLAPSVGV